MALSLKGGLDILFPPLCIACREPGASSGFCADCWGTIQFLDGPLCGRCGIPFEVPLDGECAVCLSHPPSFDKARAILRYDDVSRAPILALKYADRLDLVPGFGQWLERAGRDLIASSDLIVPVPLHRVATGHYRPDPQPPHRQPGRHAVGQGAAAQCAGRVPGARTRKGCRTPGAGGG
jgi:predicted amidophosphoribosyltransferase